MRRVESALASSRRTSLPAVFPWCSLLVTVAQGPPGAVGRPDGDAREFAICGDYSRFRESFSSGVSFRFGEGKPERDWPYIHPGPSDAWAGSRRHPFRIEFEARPPAGEDLVVVLHLAATHGWDPPRVSVGLNGTREERDLPAGRGDGALRDPKTDRPHREEFAFPSSFLRPGTNEVEIAVVKGSWMIYDAVVFERRPAGGALRDFRLEPTPFVTGAGERVLVAALDYRGPDTTARIRGTIAGAPFERDLASLAFGRSRLDVAIPEVDRKAAVLCAIEAGGERRETSLELTPARAWTLYLGAHCHTDIGYTHVQTEAIAVHRRNVDAALDSTDPSFVWNLEVAFQARDYLRRAPPERSRKLLDALRAGRIGFHLAYLNLLSGLCSDEALARATLWGGRFARAQGIPGDLATITDVPSLCAAWPSVLAASGVRHFAHGINQTRAPMLANSPLAETPFWWEGPDGGRVLAWLSDGYGWGFRLGMTADPEAMRGPIAAFLAEEEQRGYPYDEVLLFGGVYDNRDGEIAKTAAAIRGWNEKWRLPRVVASTESAFLREVERKYGNRLPVVRGSGGAYWEDGVGTTAAMTALNRVTHARLVAAETLNAAAELVDSPEDGTAAGIDARLERAFEDLLFYDEHTWGAHNSVSSPFDPFVEEQWAVKRQFALEGAERTARLLDLGRERLASKVSAGKGTEIVVLNSLDFERTDLVRAEVPRTALRGAKAAKVVDLGTGEETPVQIGDSVAGDAVPVEFVARRVPSVGWRVFRLKPAVEAAPDAARIEGDVAEGRFYGVRLDPGTGAIASLVDRGWRREIVEEKAPFRFAETLYVSGGEGSRVAGRDESLPLPSFEFHRPTRSGVLEPRRGPVSVTLRSSAKAKRLPRIVTEVTLYRDLPRVDVAVEFTKEETVEKESVCIAFPFDATAFQFTEVAEPLAWLNLPGGLLPGACVDWFAVQEFVRFSGPHHGVTWTSLDAPLVLLDGMHVGEWRPVENFVPRADRLFSWALNNYWVTNYRASQGGEFRFRYSIRSDGGHGETWEPETLRFGRAAMTPLEAVVRSPGASEGGIRESIGSLVEVQPAEVVLNALKYAEDGRGLVARLRNVGPQAIHGQLRLPHSPKRRVRSADLLETPGEPLARDGDAWLVPIAPNGFATVRID